jgi:hypothetical protein
LNDNLTCVICLDTFKEAITLKACGHTFCSKCIHTVFTTKRRCPLFCTDNTLSGGTFESKFCPAIGINNIVAELKVHCPATVRVLTNDGGIKDVEVREGGCHMTFKLEDLHHHLSIDCKHVTVRCAATGSGCRWSDLRLHKATHEASCFYKTNGHIVRLIKTLETRVHALETQAQGYRAEKRSRS